MEEEMKLTPSQFAKQLPKWYDIWEKANPCYFPSGDEAKRYVEFLNFCEQIRQEVSVLGPRQSGAWFLADIEIALFQFVWDQNNKIV